MNKINIFLIVFIAFNIANAQKIKVNEKKFTTLLFESNVTSAIIGSDDYTFEYNEENPETIALLKANKKNVEETSLVVKTENGVLFNINIAFGEEDKNVFFLNDTLGYQIKKNTKSINKVEEVSNKVNLESNKNVKSNITENDYTIGNTVINDNENKNLSCDVCEKLLKSNKSIKRVFDEIYDVKILLNNIYYQDNKIYYVLNFKNESALDYNLNYIKSYVDTNNENKTSSSQYLEMNPVLIYNSNRTIKGNSERNFVFVYEQFSIDNNKKLTFEINESNGERNLFLKIPHFLINNPKKIK